MLNQKLLAAIFCCVLGLGASSRTLLAQAQTNLAPPDKKNEVAFLVGVNDIQDRRTALGTLSFDRSLHYQAVYARDIWGTKLVHFLAEVPVIYTPAINTGKRTQGDPASSYSSLLVTVGGRAKFFPKKWYSPWVGAGYGWSTSSASSHLLDGAQNLQTRDASGKAWQYAGGLDLKLTSRFSIRAEARDFYTVVPALALPQNESRFRNLLYSGGVVFHF